MNHQDKEIEKLVSNLITHSLVLIYCLFGYFLFFAVACDTIEKARADEPERMAIFTQPDGTQLVETCFEDSICTYEKMTWDELEKIEKEE